MTKNRERQKERCGEGDAASVVDTAASRRHEGVREKKNAGSSKDEARDETDHPSHQPRFIASRREREKTTRVYDVVHPPSPPSALLHVSTPSSVILHTNARASSYAQPHKDSDGNRRGEVERGRAREQEKGRTWQQCERAPLTDSRKHFASSMCHSLTTTSAQRRVQPQLAHLCCTAATSWPLRIGFPAAKSGYAPKGISLSILGYVLRDRRHTGLAGLPTLIQADRVQGLAGKQRRCAPVVRVAGECRPGV